MNLALVGLSHHHAPIEVREKLSCPDHMLGSALQALHGRQGVREAALLFTCNRTEIYAVLESVDPESGFAALRAHLSAFHNVPEPLFSPYLYCESREDAARHLARVASGLDSLVLGETQILGQVRNALRAAQKAGAAGSELIPLFEHALTCGKRVQTETTLRQGSMSIGTAAVDLATRIFGDLTGAKALILGAGKMSELTASDLVSNGVKFVLVANRTYEKAVELAGRLGGQAIHYDTFPDNLITTDIVISSTAAPHPIVTREMLQPILRKRKGKPLFLIDIAVPRDIEASVGDIDNVFLYNIDDLQEVAAEGARGRAERAQAQAESIANEETARFLSRYRTRSVAPVLGRIRSQAGAMVDNRLVVLRSRLGPISDRDWNIIATQFQSLADEMVLAPTLRLKRAAAEASEATSETPQYELADAARELFGLDDKIDTPTDPAPPLALTTVEEAMPLEPLQEVNL